MPSETPSPQISDEEEKVDHPAKVVRLATMTAGLLEELRRSDLDEFGCQRLQAIYATAGGEVSDGLSGDLRNELERMRPKIEGGTASESELRIAHAQLVGWLEGLVQGMQAAVAIRQLAAQSQQSEPSPPSIQQTPLSRDASYL
jgi:hypothetical protein